MNQLIVENINFSYGKKSILRDINFKVENGLIGLLGKNGAGKTTLIKILVTLYRPSSGSIVFNGYKYNNYTNEIRKYLGYLQQDFNMYKNLTGLDYLKFVAKMRNIKNIDEEIKEICDMLNLDKYIKNDNAFKGVAYVTLLVSILSVGSSLFNITQVSDLLSKLPLAQYGFNWVLPAILGGVIGNFIKTKKNVNSNQKAI